LPANEVYLLWKDQIPYERSKTSGDFNKSGKKTGTTEKIYLPLHAMFDFQSLFTVFDHYLKQYLWEEEVWE